MTPKKTKNFQMLNIFIKGKGLFITHITMTKQTANKDFFQWFGNILGLVGHTGYELAIKLETRLTHNDNL